PDPEKIETLYSEIRRVAPDLKVLHLDNINPGAVASFPRESSKIAKIISRYNTPGDTAAMGLESVDPTVFELNSLKCDRREAVRAVEIINEFGAERSNGIPKLLPGLNLIQGLPGESDQTFQQNFEFLSEILERNLLLRRINIRQVTVHSHTKLERLKNDNNLCERVNLSKKHMKPALLENKYRYYRDRIRAEIDRPMLERVFPPGTILKEVIPEVTNPGYILGRQLGSYPVTVKIPVSDKNAVLALESRQPIDIIITGYGERSLLGLVHPIQINAIGQKALEQIPGIGKRRATAIFMARPLANMDDLSFQIDGTVFGNSSDYCFEKIE
ncbi:radical SAM protein, partial [bacterium]|nr:radical SAM protein [bacterium]